MTITSFDSEFLKRLGADGEPIRVLTEDEVAEYSWITEENVPITQDFINGYRIGRCMGELLAKREYEDALRMQETEGQ